MEINKASFLPTTKDWPLNPPFSLRNLLTVWPLQFVLATQVKMFLLAVLCHLYKDLSIPLIMEARVGSHLYQTVTGGMTRPHLLLASPSFQKTLQLQAI